MAFYILALFLFLRLGQFLFEANLARINRLYYLDKDRQQQACQTLDISNEDMKKTLSYTEDKYHFAKWSGFFDIAVVLAFLAFGGLGYVEQVAVKSLSLIGVAPNELMVGLAFFGILGLLASLVSLPFSYYSTFVIEQRHGFNKTDLKTFITDRVKGLVLGGVLGGIILGAILWIMQAAGQYWWLYAWLVLSGFSVLTAWIYPTLLAPLFNKFSPLPEGELKEQILTLAKKVDFNAAGLSVMDASKRSSHGNAYFTGMFGAKKIVLFDTLVEALKVREIVAVLAHELGHFKLNHVRWNIVRSIAMTGLMFFLLSLFLPLKTLYEAFGLQGVDGAVISTYGALTVFSLWFGLFSFFLQPWESYLSRRNEFAADAFALKQIADREELASALLKLREKSHAMPLAHPTFSMFYYSHPPMVERLAAMRALEL